jgi:MYXO-CTERM domain-containing protein
LDVDIDAISVAAPLPPKADAGVPTPDAGDPDGGVTNGLDGAQVGGAGCACRTGGASDDATSRSAGGLAALGLAALSAALLVRRRRPPR